MASRSPTEHHSSWTPVAKVSALPNASGAPLPLPSFFLEAGDTCYVTGVGLFFCASPGSAGGGNATWVQLATVP